MKLLVCTKPGLLEYKDINEPIVQPGHAVIKIKQVGICGTDLHAFEGTQPYFNYPRILGHEIAAEIADATYADGFRINDPVTILPYFNCGVCKACVTGKPNCCVQLKVCGVHVDGAMVEYLSVPVHSLLAAEGFTHDELALVEPLAIGAHAIRRAAVQPGETVLVIGAGPIGMGIIEFAHIAGGKVIVMDVNDDRLQFCQQHLPVSAMINAGSSNLTEMLLEYTSNAMPDVVIDATGNLKAINNAFQYVSHGGRYVLVGLQKEFITFSHPEFHKREATLMSSRNATREDFIHVMNALKKGLVKPVTYITHRIDFASLKDQFPSLLDPGNKVIKAMVTIN